MRKIRKYLAALICMAMIISMTGGINAKAATEIDVPVWDQEDGTTNSKVHIQLDSSKPFEDYNDHDGHVQFYQVVEGGGLQSLLTKKDEGYDAFALMVHVQEFAATQWNEGDQIQASITINIPSGYDASSLKRIMMACEPPAYENYDKANATSFTDTTATFPAILHVRSYGGGLMLKCEIGIEIKKKVVKNQEYSSQAKDANYKIINDESGKVEVTYAKSLGESKDVKIPDEVILSDGTKAKVIGIEDNALKGNKTVTNLEIGNNVETIGVSAFEGCVNLKSFKMGSNVKTIGKNAFKKCKKLTKATLSDSVTEIGAYAFNGDSKLGKLTIGKNVKKIGKGAIKNIKPTATIKIRGSKKQKAAIKKKVTKSSTGFKKTMKVK